MVLRNAAAGVLAAVVAVGLAACTNPLGPHNVITSVDRHRLAVMRADPIFRTAVPGTSSATVGETWDPDSWRRGQVSAEIYRQYSTTDTLSPLPVQEFVRGLIAGMQARGWVVYYADCDFDSLNPGVPPGVPDGPAWWYDTVYAYRIYQGVSYWAQLEINADASANDRRGFESYVTATLMVPAASELANLFGDHPAGIALGAICAAQPAQLTAPVTQGTPIRVSPQSDRADSPSPGPQDTAR